MKKVLVTGTCGFIFGNFIRKAIYDQNQKKSQDRAYTFVSVDRVTANALNSMYWNKNHIFHPADIRDSHVMDVIFQFEKPDIVIHGAAETYVDTSLKDPNSFVTSNVLGTQVIINSCLKHKVEKLVYISCYDEKTKAVTKNGLKSLDQLKIGDLVLSINPDSGVIEEKEIEKIIIQDYNGEMCSFDSSRFNALTTPNHRFIYNQNNNLNWTTAEELNSINGKKYLPNGKISRLHGSIINIPTIGDVDSNAFFYVCGAFIGDGFTAYQEKSVKNKSGFTRTEFLKKAKNPKTGRFDIVVNNNDPQTESLSHSYRIFFDVPQNDKCRKKLEESLTKLNIKWYAEKNKSGEHIYFTSKEWMMLFNTFGKYAANKHIPNWMFDYSYDNLHHLLLGIHDSDGHGWNIKGRNSSITTVSLRLRDQLCYLCSMLGFFAKFSKKRDSLKSIIDGRKINKNHDAWLIYFSNKRHPLFPKSSNIDYNGKIWCLKVKDNKNFLVERNGITYFSGNTDEVYGQLTSESEPPWNEESPLDPRNPYSASKAAGELMVKAAHTTHGLIYNITRSSNCYGPRQLPEKLVPKAIKCVLEGNPIPIYGQGLQIRDWTYVADNCTAIMAVLDKGSPNQIYNISANQEFTNIETIQSVCNAMGKGHELISFIPDPRGGHDFRYAINTSKIRELGWKPSYKFKDGIKDTVQWYTDNQWFLK